MLHTVIFPRWRQLWCSRGKHQSGDPHTLTDTDTQRVSSADRLFISGGVRIPSSNAQPTQTPFTKGGGNLSGQWLPQILFPLLPKRFLGFVQKTNVWTDRHDQVKWTTQILEEGERGDLGILGPLAVPTIFLHPTHKPKRCGPQQFGFWLKETTVPFQFEATVGKLWFPE